MARFSLYSNAALYLALCCAPAPSQTAQGMDFVAHSFGGVLAIGILDTTLRVAVFLL
jgi:hypothetical protein